MKQKIFTKPFTLLIVAVIFSTQVFATIIQSNVPDLGQRTHLEVTAAQEAELGETLLQKIRASDLISEDRVVSEYLGSVSTRLAKAADHLDFKLHLFAVNSPELNAFTFFGGHIAVHTGLILALKNENELAGVLAHETAHIAQRHLARMLANNKRLMPLTYAELLAAVAIGALGAPEAGSHLASAVMAGHVQQLINFTRDHEQEADRVGIQILSKAGYDPAALPAVLRTLSLKTRFQERPPEYLLTHPVYESRIADCANRAERIPRRHSADSLFFHLVRARIETELSGNAKQRIKVLGDRLANGQYTHKTAAEYAYALALAKNKQYQEATQQLKALAEQNPDNWVFSFTCAEVDLAAGLTQAAIDRLQLLHEQHPNNSAIIVKHAQALLQGKQMLAAERILFQYRRSHTEDPEVLQLLVQIYSRLKQPTVLHQMQAEWHALRGEFKEAFQQLDIALEYANPQSHLAKTIRLRKQTLLEQSERQKQKP